METMTPSIENDFFQKLDRPIPILTFSTSQVSHINFSESYM